MPLNSIPPTTTVPNLEQKLQAAKDQCRIDVGFWGGVIPGNQEELIPLVRAGVKGFKCFLIDSGVEEFPCVSAEDVKQAMSKLQEVDSLLLFHAELDCPSSNHSHPEKEPDPTLYSTFLDSRSTKFETDAISKLIELNLIFPKLRTHIVHLSAADALPMINRARSQGLALSTETCLHYLTLSSDSIPNGKPEYKCCPPIRTSANQDLLWDALLKNEIDFIVSDHSPCTSDLKENSDLMKAWGGISGLGLGLSLIWNEGKKRKIKNLESWILSWFCERPARFIGLDHLKGHIRVGAQCDLCIFDPNQSFQVTKATLNFKNKISPYIGMNLTGKVIQTILNAQTVYKIDPSDLKSDGFRAFENLRIGKLLI